LTVIAVKHHGGVRLWPSKHTGHSVKKLADASRKRTLDFSPATTQYLAR
jgi:alpha-L-fucosidase